MGCADITLPSAQFGIISGKQCLRLRDLLRDSIVEVRDWRSKRTPEQDSVTMNGYGYLNVEHFTSGGDDGRCDNLRGTPRLKSQCCQKSPAYERA